MRARIKAANDEIRDTIGVECGEKYHAKIISADCRAGKAKDRSQAKV